MPASPLIRRFLAQKPLPNSDHGEADKDSTAKYEVGVACTEVEVQVYRGLSRVEGLAAVLESASVSETLGFRP
ncbi:hypothetical protein GOBAR_DD11839 [Gossypium barbadense]|nr:hypothetical protein GOBAR_DD11839 [Gossypium barbadense]